MKIAINTCWGGFGLSEKAYEHLGIEWDGYGYKYADYDKRTDSALIECIETLGKEANGHFSALKVIEIPDDVDWEISSYDGWEKIEERHRVWE